MKKIFNTEEGLFKGAKEGKASGIIFTLLLPIIVIFLSGIFMILPISLCSLLFEIFPEMSKYLFQLNLIISTGTTIIIYFLFIKLKEKRSISSIGLKFNKKSIFQYLKGFFIGIIMMELVAIIIVATGSGELNFNKSLDMSFIVPFLLVMIAWIIQGASEEIMIRGHMMPMLSNKMAPIISIIISSSYFGILHLGNPGIAPLAIVNLILFGVFAAVYAIHEKSLFGVCAIHSAWNFAQGNIFGFLVSGMPADGGILIQTKITNDNVINGGSFGPEGGLAVSIILIIAILVVLALIVRKNRVSE